MLDLAIVFYSPELNHSACTDGQHPGWDPFNSSVFIRLLVLHLPPFFGNVRPSACLLSLEGTPPLNQPRSQMLLNTLFIPGLTCDKHAAQQVGGVITDSQNVERRLNRLQSKLATSLPPHLLRGTAEEPSHSHSQLLINWVKLVKLALDQKPESRH